MLLAILWLSTEAAAWEMNTWVRDTYGCSLASTFPLTLASEEDSLPVYFAHGEPGWTAIWRARAIAAMEIYSAPTALPASTWSWESEGLLETFVHDPDLDSDLPEDVRASYEQMVQLVWLTPSEFNSISEDLGGGPNLRAVTWIQVHNDDPCDTSRWMFAIAFNQAYAWKTPLPVELSWELPSATHPAALNSFPTALAHELGHIVGLGHICRPGASSSGPCYPDLMHPGSPGVVAGDERNAALDPAPFQLSPDMASGLGTLYPAPVPGGLNLQLMKFHDGPALDIGYPERRRPRETWTEAWADLTNESWDCFHCEDPTAVPENAMLITAGMAGSGCVETEVVFRLTWDEYSDCDIDSEYTLTLPISWHNWVVDGIEDTVPITLCESETVSVGPEWISLPEGYSGSPWRICAVIDPYEELADVDRSDNRVMSDMLLDVHEFGYETPVCSLVTLP